MTYIFNLNGETPSKKNSRVTNRKTGRTFPNKRFTDWHASALAAIIDQKQKLNLIDPINKPVTITLLFTHGDKRRRDSDNGTSSIFDLLKDARVLDDDNYNIITSHLVFNDYEKDAAGVIIIIDTVTNPTATIQKLKALFNS